MIITIGFVAFLISYAGVGAFRLWATKRNILDVPNARSSHVVPTPRGGGLVITAITLIGVWALADLLGFLPHWRILIAYTLGAALVANVSWLDDLRPLPSWIRFSAHSIAAACVVFGAGYYRDVTLPMAGNIQLGWAGPILTFIWIVALTNAYNFMDGIDGIAGGQAVTASLGWAVLG